jgi:hypothetical protein
VNDEEEEENKYRTLKDNKHLTIGHSKPLSKLEFAFLVQGPIKQIMLAGRTVHKQVAKRDVESQQVAKSCGQAPVDKSWFMLFTKYLILHTLGIEHNLFD